MLRYLLLEQLSMQVCRWYQAARAGPTKKLRKSHYWEDQWAVIRVFVVPRWEARYEY